MKRYLVVLLLALPCMVNAQANYIQIGVNNSDTTTERYVTFSPTNTQGNRRAIEKIRDSAYWSIRTLRAFIRAVDSTKSPINNPSNLIWVSSFGELRRADIGSVVLDTASLYASKAWVQSKGYLTQDNVYSAGYGITKSGTEPSASFSVNQTDIMTVNRATDSIDVLKTQITNKADKSTLLTINGVAQNISQNRTWSVGDVVSSGSYSNPTWITSLAWSKISGTPTTLSGYGITDGITSSALTSTLANYVTSSSLSSTLGNYATTASVTGLARGAISLTTTGTSGAAAYNSSTGVLNIPQYTGTTYTAGSGIGIASNVITNTAPDQTVTLTAGRGIVVTGTYPNFTISMVTPTINIVTRPLNTNFTPSATKETYVTYSVTCTVTNPLLVGTSTAMAYLEYSINGGSTWFLPSQNGNSSGVGITVTVQLTNGQTGTLVGYIPANALVRIRTSTTGSGNISYVTGSEMNY